MMRWRRGSRPLYMRFHKKGLPGQSLVEMALMLTILLLILSGLVEFGFWMLDYSNVVMATRNAARFAVDNDHTYLRAECQPWNSKDPTCNPWDPSFDETVCNEDFYCKISRLTQQTMEQHAPPVQLDPTLGDDIVISVFTFTEGVGSVVTDRHPNPSGYWSYFGNQGSRMSNADIQNLLSSQGVAHTSAGYVLIEVYYHYKHKLGLPWLKAFVPDPLPLYAYTFMPLYSAAPTPTP